VSKFAYHIAFYRQSVMYARHGVEIEPGTMGYWLGSLRTHQSHSRTVHIVVVNEICDGANFHQINAAVWL